MSKKKKKKFDKKLIAERLRELENETRAQKTKKEPQPQILPTQKETKGKTAPQKEELNQKDQLILKDIKRVGITALIIFLIFAALFFVNQKTNYLLRTSDKILNLLHVGQL